MTGNDLNIPSRWRQHLTLDLPESKAARPIWVHACSVGEVSSVAPLIEGLLDMGHTVHLTMVTDTGFAHAQRLFGGTVSLAYLPWDFPGLMRRMIAHLKPGLLLLCETEFWPGMLRSCRRFNIPVVGINTRISDRSFPRYRATRWLWRHWLKGVKLFLAQSDIDAERLKSMGVKKKRIRCVGHLKYAVRPPLVDSEALRLKVDASGKRPLLLAGSTHDNEEETLCRMFAAWKQAAPNLLLVLVPRHPQRFTPVIDSMTATGLRTARWSQGAAGRNHDAIVIDEMGVLGGMYSIADIVFIGGSLIPHGGQNPLEAAVCGRGVITGPHMHNFTAIMQDMRHAGAAVQCADAAEVEASVQRFISHPDELRQLHAHAAVFMQDRADVTRKMLKAIKPWLENTSLTAEVEP
ncbi:MAG: 3-deoxy-D-manno-octulosonic acid transferase [Zetaproteobacteria bacterium CG06_land_8_20_14_3_00_59_53]|nr:MAG: 3-deoxy-D-manno-octulosonic acid transferase [Zetaproteobacteria bacterium CG23_combo_of_CG06-09_8_20_14_all_59_86]PIQ65428.1 MAG: 3-deoxy-D-manno-octulosonic acid transferase [Zetaproteobacteria bacterium CG11_big_fil_rev_8_21_14_0_20_59_439]PIU69680.1 MAG: 3-deoxy-D-manno-octulosonic acid transferase [Zetaproteobacteria bacterium CG06_land_8_20_14_3_00_59_53]PIU96926.1 MAG: 3-deoxy-D-manno-octulosonic acid transferase [Zetaproteobacteria bacterium CG03_land_8_20_14_0_80_59_51]PIY47595